MAEKYSTIQQHQPLRVPSSFDKQGRALVVQLDEIFDDIYRRFGRLRTEDLGGSLKNLILMKDDGGNYVSISTTIDGIEAQVANCYGKQSNIDITAEGIELSGGTYVQIKTQNDENVVRLDETGITMETEGKVYIHAKDETASAIIFGTDETDAQFSVDLDGDLFSKTVTTESFTLAGFEMPTVIVDENQPDAHGIVWIKPTRLQSKQWSYYPENRTLNSSGGLGHYRDYQIPYKASDYLSGDNLYYGIRTRLYVYSFGGASHVSAQFRASLWNGSSWITLKTASKTFYSYGYLTIDVDLSELNTNVMVNSDSYFLIRLETNLAYNLCRLADENILFRAKTTNSSTEGAATCTVYYLT